MNLISWLLTFSFLIIVGHEAFEFHQRSVCRQESWLWHTERITGSTLTHSKLSSTLTMSCRMRKARGEVYMPLKGKL